MCDWFQEHAAAISCIFLSTEKPLEDRLYHIFSLRASVTLLSVLITILQGIHKHLLICVKEKWLLNAVLLNEVSVLLINNHIQIYTALQGI